MRILLALFVMLAALSTGCSNKAEDPAPAPPVAQEQPTTAAPTTTTSSTAQPQTDEERDDAFTLLVSSKLKNPTLAALGVGGLGRAVCEGFRSGTRTYPQQVRAMTRVSNDPESFVAFAVRIYCPDFTSEVPGSG